AARELAPDPGVQRIHPLRTGGRPRDFGHGRPASWAWMTMRCRAENRGWHVVRVRNRPNGAIPGWSGTGVITSVSDGSTISRPVMQSRPGTAGSPVRRSPSTWYTYYDALVSIPIP